MYIVRGDLEGELDCGRECLGIFEGKVYGEYQKEIFNYIAINIVILDCFGLNSTYIFRAKPISVDIFPQFNFNIIYNSAKGKLEYYILDYDYDYGGREWDDYKEWDNLGEFEVMIRYGIDKGKVKEISYKEFIEAFLGNEGSRID